KKLAVVKKHLGDNVFSSRIHLCFQVLQVKLHAGRFKMLLWISCHAYAKIGLKTNFSFFMKVFSVVHPIYLCHKLTGVVMSADFWDKFSLHLGGISPQSQHILNPDKIKVYQYIFCFFFCESPAQQMWYSIHVKPIH